MAFVKDLIQTIIEKTRAGKLLWSEVGSNAFVTTIGDNSAVISRRGEIYDLYFRNSEGRMLEEIETDRPEFDGINLDELYEIVRRQAFRVDETLMEIKRSLDKL
jgi:hypothetical protein